MKKTMFVWLGAVLLTGCTGQSVKIAPREAETPRRDVKSVNEISHFVDITDSNLSGMRKVEKDVYDTSEGSHLIGFYDGIELRKISATNYGAMGVREANFYFMQNRLVYACQETQYQMTETDFSNSSRREIKRAEFYFREGKLLRAFNEENLGRDTSSLESQANEIRDEAAHYADMMSVGK